MSSDLPRMLPVDREELLRKKTVEELRVYVDAEGRPWRKTERDQFVRIPVERKPV